MTRLFCASIGAAFLLFVAPALAQPASATLIVKVEGVSPKGGDMRVALYTADTWKDDTSKPVIDGVIPAVAPETIVTLRNVPPGTYGLKAFQDYNRNGEFDFTALHLPAEKYGFSRDATPFFSDPAFNRAKFNLPPGETTITIHLR
ncbi:MAG TPA: DUF2141 domain-containing protein [Rhizomicrobium sp.]